MSLSRDVACVGELLIDFVCSDIGTDLSKGSVLLKKQAGLQPMLLAQFHA